MKTQKKEVIKKLVTFTPEEWEFIQSYKHANKLKTDMQAIKDPILEKKASKQKVFNAFFANKDNQKILKKLADK
jgi:hypothetical protein